MRTLSDVFVVVATGICDTESCLSKALPLFATVATDPGLKAALVAGCEESEAHVLMLQRVFAEFGWPPPGNRPDSRNGHLRRELSLSGNYGTPQNVDVGLVYAVQRIGHYKMATYECLRDWALHLGQPRAAERLQEIRAREVAADAALARLARRLGSIEAGAASQETSMAA